MRNVATASQSILNPFLLSYLAPSNIYNGHHARNEDDGQGCEAYTPPPSLAISGTACMYCGHAGCAVKL